MALTAEEKGRMRRQQQRIADRPLAKLTEDELSALMLLRTAIPVLREPIASALSDLELLAGFEADARADAPPAQTKGGSERG